MPIEHKADSPKTVIEDAKRRLAQMLEDLAPYLPEPDIHSQPTAGQWESSGRATPTDRLAKRQRYFAALS